MAKPKKGGFGGNIFGQSESDKTQSNEQLPQEEQQIIEPSVPKAPLVSKKQTAKKQTEVNRTRYTIMIEEELLHNVKLFATLKRRKIYEIFEIAVSGYLDANFTTEHRQRLEELQNLE